MEKSTIDILTHGITRRQRHVILEKMIEAAIPTEGPETAKGGAEGPEGSPFGGARAPTGVVPCGKVSLREPPQEYFTRVEQRLYTGVFGLNLPIFYNKYRGEIYRRRAFQLIWALRANANYLMLTYDAELLACLPGEILCIGTKAGKIYEAWKEKQDYERQVEHDARHEKKTAKGVGWYKCPKCGGKFDVRELQMRGADEPATIFRTCGNCNFTKRNG